MIIGITGTLGAGKGSVVKYLVEKGGFKHFSVRAYLIEEIQRRGLPVNRDSMVEVANDLRQKNSSDYIIRELIDKAKAVGGDVIIESIRTVGEAETIKQKGGYLIAVDADAKVRYSRVLIRQSETDNISYEEFLENEEREFENENPNKQNLSKCIEMSDYVIKNDKDFQELYKKIKEVYVDILEKEKAKHEAIQAKEVQRDDNVAKGTQLIEMMRQRGVIPAEEVKNNEVSGRESSELIEKKEDAVLENKEENVKEREIEVKKEEVQREEIKEEVIEKKVSGRLLWDEYFMKLTALVAERSSCLRHHIGAIIVKNKRVLTTGYNGATSGMPNCCDIGCLKDEQNIASGYGHETCRAIHAEQNAIIQAAIHGVNVSGATMYCTHTPCGVCAKLIANSGIKEVVSYHDYSDKDAMKFLYEAGVKLRKVPRPDKEIKFKD